MGLRRTPRRSSFLLIITDGVEFRGLRAPQVLKGVQCGEDAVLAAAAGVDGIIVSNHGGRQLDYARSALEALPEVR